MGAFSRETPGRTMLKTIVLAPEPVSKARKNRRRYEGGAAERTERRGERVGEGRKETVLARPYSPSSYLDENDPRNLSHDPGASWDRGVEGLRVK